MNELNASLEALKKEIVGDPRAALAAVGVDVVMWEHSGKNVKERI